MFYGMRICQVNRRIFGVFGRRVCRMDSEKESIESILSQAGIKISLSCPRARESSSDVDLRPDARSSNAQHAVEEDRDVQSVLKNRDFFTLLFTRHPLSAVTDIHDFYYFLLLRKISIIQELVRNQDNSQALNDIADAATGVYMKWKGPAIKYINDHNEEIFSESQTDRDIKYAALDSIIHFKGGICNDVFKYLCQKYPFMIIERFDDLEDIFNKSTKTDKPDEDLFYILFHSGIRLSVDVPSYQKLINSLWFQTVLNIWKKEYSKNNRHRHQIEQYIAELRSYAELLCGNLTEDNVYEAETAVRSLSSFLNQVKIYKSDVLSEHGTAVEKLKRQLLYDKVVFVQKLFDNMGAEDWSRMPYSNSKLPWFTHYDNNQSYLTKKNETAKYSLCTDIPDEQFFSLEFLRKLSNLEGFRDEVFLETLRYPPAFDNYSRLIEYTAQDISKKMSKQDYGFVEDVDMMLVMLRLAYQDVNKTSEEQEILCYSLSMFLCSLSEKFLRLFNLYLTKNKDSENATLGDLLNGNKKELAYAFGCDHIRILAYFLTSTLDLKLGRNYRNSLAHWSSGLETSDMTPILAASLLWLFTDILNSVSIYFDNQQ